MSLYSLSHSIQPWLFPPGFNLLLGIIGFILWSHFRSLARIIITISFVSLWLLSFPLIAQHLINGLQNQYSALQADRIIKQNTRIAIVVLGSKSLKSPEYENKRTVSDTALSRLRYAAYLFRKTNSPIIVSGGNPDGSSYTEGDLMLEVLKKDFKIPAELKENKSINTADEAQLLVPLLKQHHINTIYLITNAWHMPRSAYAFTEAFKQLGVKIIPAPMGYINLKSELSLLNYLPSLGALSTSVNALHEYIGILWYHLYYGHSQKPHNTSLQHAAT